MNVWAKRLATIIFKRNIELVIASLFKLNKSLCHSSHSNYYNTNEKSRVVPFETRTYRIC